MKAIESRVHLLSSEISIPLLSASSSSCFFFLLTHNKHWRLHWCFLDFSDRRRARGRWPSCDSPRNPCDETQNNRDHHWRRQKEKEAKASNRESSEVDREKEKQVERTIAESCTTRNMNMESQESGEQLESELEKRKRRVMGESQAELPGNQWQETNKMNRSGYGDIAMVANEFPNPSGATFLMIWTTSCLCSMLRSVSPQENTWWWNCEFHNVKALSLLLHHEWWSLHLAKGAWNSEKRRHLSTRL